MDINLVRIVFIFNSLFTGLIGVLIGACEPYLPIVITRTYCYGKHAVTADQPLVKKVEVPKRWFAHFYIFAAPASTCMLLLVINRYWYNIDAPQFVYNILDFLLGSSRKSLVPPERTFLAAILLTIQCWKRLYETCFVSVFSDSKINISHYIVGFVHYIGTISSVIGESRGFVRGSAGNFHWDGISYTLRFCAAIFLWASYWQLKTNYTLVRLRKNEKGVVVTKSYKIPRGELFDYISGPLQFTEILMYLALSIILWPSTTYHWIFIWVLINQTSCAFMSHRWYLQTFKNYPKERKRLIPFIL
ncbi:polyprenol reductase [Orussus abietinus]|uniref:polyprenol reductase n=1 Tax=Orussus abietinus TaxID=222816 RepID=UPI000625825E|nr:polyprenol reductase [Orussus abietinus]XP_012282307.1 polyprenol reductase [Orussus abietinus]XP_012282308.1 polyprenol reductase [Orussus abietinus]XP_012282309.1 polyprenol reductase [Orussus abietinus]XP_023287773.1 polyprenol reductase [Orussus abietinus]